MRSVFTLLPLVALATVSAQAAPDDEQIVVTGKPLSETAADLAACLARGCPVDEDIAATLAHSENQFVAGRYKDARTTLLKSIDRNKRAGQAFPIPMSDLYRANSRVAEHVGEARSYQSSVLTMRDTLRDGLGGDNPRALAAQIEVGDSRAKLGFPDEADRIYAAVEQDALALGQNRIATYARLRQGVLAQISADDTNLASERKRARLLLENIVNDPLPGTEDLRLAAQVTMARIDRKAGIAATTEALLRQFADAGGASRPILLSAEIIERINADGRANPASEELYRAGGPTAFSMDTVKRLTANNSIAKWVDIGFWVTPDGRVSDIEVLRERGGTQWLKPVVAHLNSRVYAPLKAGADGVNPGFYMVERYSLTARWTDDATGTHMRRREATPRIERLDITPEDYAQPTFADAGKTGGSGADSRPL